MLHSPNTLPTAKSSFPELCFSSMNPRNSCQQQRYTLGFTRQQNCLGSYHLYPIWWMEMLAKPRVQHGDTSPPPHLSRRAVGTNRGTQDVG